MVPFFKTTLTTVLIYHFFCICTKIFVYIYDLNDMGKEPLSQTASPWVF